MKKLIDKLAEKFYYKRFPERIHEHEIAISPLPVIREERYHPITVYADKLYFQREVFLEEYLSQDIIRQDLVKIMSSELVKYITFERIEEPGDRERGFTRYRGSLKILKEEA